MDPLHEPQTDVSSCEPWIKQNFKKKKKASPATSQSVAQVTEL